ncbi:37928_t:CDS:2, partial [Gigaspora margarita]
FNDIFKLQNLQTQYVDDPAQGKKQISQKKKKSLIEKCTPTSKFEASNTSFHYCISTSQSEGPHDPFPNSIAFLREVSTNSTNDYQPPINYYLDYLPYQLTNNINSQSFPIPDGLFDKKKM